MKKLLIVFVLLLGVQLSYAQDRVHTDYMELRLMFGNTWSFRLSPTLPFQKMGLFGKHIKPYFKDSPEAMKHFKGYRRNMLSSLAWASVGGAGIGYGLVSYWDNDNTGVIIGSSVFLISMSVGMYFSYKQFNLLQKAVDKYNQFKNPSLTQLRPFLPSLEVTASEAHLGMGLVWKLN